MQNTSAILLAAGLSRRMGRQDKLLLEYKGKPLLWHAVQLLASLPCREKILVTSPQRLESIALPCGVKAVINHTPQDGQSKSLRLGLEAATGDRYLFLNADQPRLRLSALAPMFELAAQHTEKIIYPVVDGNPCTPVLFPARFRAALFSQTNDTGGRAVRAANPEACLTFDAENPQNFMDVDSLEDYRVLCASDL